MSEDQSISSWHCLFPNEQQTEILKSAGFSIREGVQFQWFNRDYYDFSDFLQTLTSEKRKMIKRERRKVLEAGIELIAIAGCDITLHHWQLFFQCYQMTYFKNGMQPYLNLDFFVECQHSMPDNLLLTLVRKNGEYIAAALYIIGTNTLYGRYWGCLQEHSFLHFEACYYHGIDQCIARKLKRFDSGAQGEHKITRGFTPIKTYSAHWLRNAIFADAVESFLAKERKAMHNYHLQANSYLPFKKTQR